MENKPWSKYTKLVLGLRKSLNKYPPVKAKLSLDRPYFKALEEKNPENKKQKRPAQDDKPTFQENGFAPSSHLTPDVEFLLSEESWMTRKNHFFPAFPPHRQTADKG